MVGRFLPHDHALSASQDVSRRPKSAQRVLHQRLEGAKSVQTQYALHDNAGLWVIPGTSSADGDRRALNKKQQEGCG